MNAKHKPRNGRLNEKPIPVHISYLPIHRSALTKGSIANVPPSSFRTAQGQIVFVYLKDLIAGSSLLNSIPCLQLYVNLNGWLAIPDGCQMVV